MANAFSISIRLLHPGAAPLPGEAAVFVVAVPDLFAKHLVTKVMEDWRQAVRWARKHSIDGCALIRDQRIDREFCTENIHDSELDWTYV